MYLLTKLYRWIRFRHGFGVHSPFAFSLINDVIEESHYYYFYTDIIDRIKRLKTTPYFSPTSLKNNRLFFRLSNRFQPKKVLLIGCETTETILYFQAAHPGRECILIETNSSKADTEFAMIESDKNLHLIEREIKELDETIEQQIIKTEFDMVLIHHTISGLVKQNTLNLCLKYRKEPRIVIVDGLSKTEELKSFWDTAILNPEVTITFNLINIGIIIINPNLKKQNYKLAF